MSRTLWVRATLIALLAVIASGAALLLDPLIPSGLAERFGEEAVTPVLNILATSMLAVTTFSLNVMVAAYRQASGQVTPRSHRILLEDTTTQTVLATFLGAFIFALLAIILFRANVYDQRASVIVFGFSAAVVVMVIVAILRWIDHLSRLGSMDETLRQVEERARASLEQYRARPCLGATCLTDRATIPERSVEVLSDTGGYVQFIDIPSLSACASDTDADIFLVAPPGSHVVKGQALAYVAGTDDDVGPKVRAAYTLDDTRTFDQDVRFGLIVLSEIASRALSPGLNDPGTAIDVIVRLERLLAQFVPTATDSPAPVHPRIWIPAADAGTLVGDAFDAIARDGASHVEVGLHLQKALCTLRTRKDPALAEAASKAAQRALSLADHALTLDSDKERLHIASAL